jgi:shikimate kinase
MEKSNLILIGMPGAGKSTLGVLLAKALRRDFLDTDVALQNRQGQTLQELISRLSLEGFCKLEAEYLAGLTIHHTVIATGGSAVYYESAMKHLKQSGYALYLQLPLDILQKRLADMSARGVVIEPGQTLQTLYEKRIPLYEKYADLTIPLAGLTHEQALQRILQHLSCFLDIRPVG